MKVKILLANLLFLEFFIKGKCVVVRKTNQTCSFSLSNGDYDEFLEAVPLFKNCTRQSLKPSLKIKLTNYTLPAFPNGTFTNLPHLRSFELEIDNGSQIQLLSPMLPNYFVFEGLKFNKAVFDISHSESIIGWKWEALFNITYDQIEFFEFIVKRTKIILLSSNFGKIAHGRLTAIRIFSCQLRWLSKNVFGPHSNLMTLELRNNLIEKFERFHLPHNTSKLKALDLGNNRLQCISEDVFINMKLEELFLDGNNIKFLSSQMESITGSEIPSIYGVTWPCDCSNILKLFSKWDYFFLKEECYINGSITEVEDFMKSCNSEG